MHTGIVLKARAATFSSSIFPFRYSLFLKFLFVFFVLEIEKRVSWAVPARLSIFNCGCVDHLFF